MVLFKQHMLRGYCRTKSNYEISIIWSGSVDIVEFHVTLVVFICACCSIVLSEYERFNWEPPTAAQQHLKAPCLVLPQLPPYQGWGLGGVEADSFNIM